MKKTFEIVRTTAHLFSRFSLENPEKFMIEVFGKNDPVLADKCRADANSCPLDLLMFICNLNDGERKALAKYINKVA